MPAQLRPDSALTDIADDCLRRRPFAEALTRELRSLPRGRSHAIGLVGPSGSGRTTLLNFIEAGLDGDHIVVHFCPSLFVSVAELGTSFFHELATQLVQKRPTLEPAGKALVRFGDTMAAIARARFDERQPPSSAQSQKEQLIAELAACDARILIVIDDLDRIEEPARLRDMCRLIRCVADVPGTTYLVAFDRPRVLGALAPDLPDGDDPLGNVFPIIHDVPAIPTGTLGLMCEAALRAALAGRWRELVAHEDWPAVFHRVIVPLLTTPRDVVRLVNAAPVALDAIRREVAAVDVVVLEAIRVVMPALHAELLGQAHVLTGAVEGEPYREEARAILAALNASAGPRAPAVGELLRRVFPRTRVVLGGADVSDDEESQWRYSRRIAAAEVFDAYARWARPAGALDPLEALSALTERRSLHRALQALGKDELLYTAEHLILDNTPLLPAGAAALITELVQRIRELVAAASADASELVRARRILRDIAPRIISRVPSAEAGDALRRTYDAMPSLSTKHWLLVAMRLADPSVDAEQTSFATQLRALVRTADPAQVAAEPGLFPLLVRYGYPRQARALCEHSTEILVNVVRSAMRFRFVDESPVRWLEWGLLHELLGDLLEVHVPVAAARSLADNDRHAIDIAQQYLVGYPIELEAAARRSALGDLVIDSLLTWEPPAEPVKRPPGLLRQHYERLLELARSPDEPAADRAAAIQELELASYDNDLGPRLIAEWHRAGWLPLPLASALASLLGDGHDTRAQVLELVSTVDTATAPVRELFRGLEQQVRLHVDTLTSDQIHRLSEAARRLLAHPADADLRRRFLTKLRVDTPP
jgi:hypothetical protein